MKRGYQQDQEHVRKRIDARLETLRTKEKPVSAEWLRRRYWDEQATCVDIGREVGKDPGTVRNWMKHYGIHTRPRGYDISRLTAGRPPGFKLSEEHKEAIRAARIRDGRIPCMKNGVHWLHTVPRSSNPRWKGGHTPERQSFYATDEWSVAVKTIWHRDDARCRRCGKDHRAIPVGERKGAFCIHHIASWSEFVALRAEPTNLVLLCRTCHLFIHSNANVTREFLAEAT